MSVPCACSSHCSPPASLTLPSTCSLRCCHKQSSTHKFIDAFGTSLRNKLALAKLFALHVLCSLMFEIYQIDMENIFASNSVWKPHGRWPAHEFEILASWWKNCYRWCGHTGWMHCQPECVQHIKSWRILYLNLQFSNLQIAYVLALNHMSNPRQPTTHSLGGGRAGPCMRHPPAPPPPPGFER